VGVLKEKILKFIPCFVRPKTARAESASPQKSGSAGARTAEAGKAAEDAAGKFLKKKGYKIIARNYRTRLGELDIVALDGKTVVFVEVRSKTEGNFGPPGASIGREKSRRITRAAWDFLARK